MFFSTCVFTQIWSMPKNDDATGNLNKERKKERLKRLIWSALQSDIMAAEMCMLYKRFKKYTLALVKGLP